MIKSLTDAFLAWKYGPLVQQPNVPSDTARDPDTSDVPGPPGAPDPGAPDVPMAYEWTIDQAFDLFSLVDHVTVTREANSISPAIDLMRHGYIAKTPDTPNAAVSVKTLELFHRLRQRKPSFSAEALTKVICDYYRVSRYATSLFHILM